MKRPPARPSILRRAAQALGIARPAEPPPAIVAAVARAEAVEAETVPAAPVAADPVAAAVAPARGRRRRRASAGEVAQGIARQLADDGLAGYPLLPDDVDAAGAAWCAGQDLEPAPPSLVREALAALPGVVRTRTRLRADDASHVALARRLRRLGRPDDRATLFTVAAVPALVHRNLSAESTRARATAGGRKGLAMRVIAPRRTESATAGTAEAAGGAESGVVSRAGVAA
jgi:hypothetical protein